MDFLGTRQTEQQELNAVSERVHRYRMMTVEEVADHFQVSRSTIDQTPREILPYVDIAPTPKRQLKRFHPLDVHSAHALLRGWREAQERNRGDAYLKELREKLEARDEQAIEMARQLVRVA